MQKYRITYQNYSLFCRPAGVSEATDKMFPAPKGRNGRHYQRHHISGVLLTFRQQLAAEFASRNCAYTAAVPAKE